MSRSISRLNTVASQRSSVPDSNRSMTMKKSQMIPTMAPKILSSRNRMDRSLYRLLS